MNKKTAGWAIYFIICTMMIAAAIRAGSRYSDYYRSTGCGIRTMAAR